MTSTPNTTPNFEFFQGTLSENSSLPRITIRRGGLMVISRATVDMVGDDVAQVQLAYDAKTGAVGIRAVSEDTAGCYRLRTQPKSPSRLVSGKRFFQHHGLKVEEARTYTAQDFGNGIVGFRFEVAADNEGVEKAVQAPQKITGRKTKTAA